MTRAEIVSEARKWVYTPYRDQGRSAHGLDCLGLLVMLGRAFGVPHTDMQGYSSWPREDRLILQTLDQQLVRMPPDSALPGLIGAFAAARRPGHVGVFSRKHDAVHLIHARMSPPVVMEDAWSGIPRRELRLVGLYALPGLED